MSFAEAGGLSHSPVGRPLYDFCLGCSLDAGGLRNQGGHSNKGERNPGDTEKHGKGPWLFLDYPDQCGRVSGTLGGLLPPSRPKQGSRSHWCFFLGISGTVNRSSCPPVELSPT